MASTTPPAPAPAPAPPAPQALRIIVRFSTGLPDLTMDVPSPQTTTVLSFKHTLRGRISSRSARLRLIYQGRILTDASSLSAVLKPLPAAPPPPPPPPSAPPPQDTKGKGKAVDRPPPAPPAPLLPVRVYLNCSIGDDLSSEELAAEKAAAQKPFEQGGGSGGGGDEAAQTAAAALSSSAWRRPRPRGFDRFLQAGFTQSEIATLRTQFASIHTERFAPDAMPSPDTLRGMEDAWIDGNAGELPSSGSLGGTGSGSGGGGGGGIFDDDMDSMSSVLDVMIRAMMIGFFFPLGSITWLLRQDVWGEKWRIFVGSGVVLSLTVGIFMTMSSER